MKYKRYDSRLKRSTNGRATAWEIKMVLGYPAKGQLPPGRYSGTVTPSGDVTVVDKRTGKVAGSMTSAQLSVLEQQEAANHSGMKVGASSVNNIGVGGSYRVPTAGYAAYQASLNPKQQQAVAKESNIINNSLSKLKVSADLILGISAALVAIGANREKAGKGYETIKSGVATAAKDLKEGLAKISSSMKILEKLKAARSKM